MDYVLQSNSYILKSNTVINVTGDEESALNDIKGGVQNLSFLPCMVRGGLMAL